MAGSPVECPWFVQTFLNASYSLDIVEGRRGPSECHMEVKLYFVRFLCGGGGSVEVWQGLPECRPGLYP